MKNKKNIVISLLAMILFIIQPVSAAKTDTTTAQVLIQGGALGVITPKASVDFGTITIDGTSKVVTADLNDMSVMDMTGTGNGWSVTVKATQFTDGTNTIPLSSMRLEGIQSIIPVGTTSAAPTVIGTGPYILDNGSANKILSAGVNKGMGKYNISFLTNALKLTVDTNKIISGSNPYVSTVTWTIVTGP